MIQGKDQGSRFELLEALIKIGRDPTNHIQLRDAEVSRHHAKIVCDADVYQLCDDHSVNGIFVNRKRVKEHVLLNGDQILLGQTLLLFADTPSNDSSRNEEEIAGKLTINKDSLQNESAVNGTAVVDEIALPHSPLFSESTEWSPQAVSHLKMMYHTTLVTSQTLEIGVLLHRILDLIFEWNHIDRGCILLYDPEALQLVPLATREASAPKGEKSSTTPFAINQSIVGYVLKRREGVLTNDVQNDSRWGEIEDDVREVICAPMMGRYGLVGIIYIDTLKDGTVISSGKPRFTEEHLQLMIAIAHQAALAVEDTRYYKGMIQGERLAAVGQTITTLSHHIKNILQGISGGSHLIQMGLDQHDETLIRQGWDIVERNQNRISHLILDMLTFSKDQEPAYELGNINDTVVEVVEMLQNYAEESKVELSIEDNVFVPDFFYDLEQIHRAIINVVMNSIDAAQNRGEELLNDSDIDLGIDTHLSHTLLSFREISKGLVQIRLSIDRSRSIVRIAIDDNGSGIPATDRQALFRPFYSHKRGRGNGLGISVAYKVVKEHGGTIRISDSPLGGARFEVELPLKLENR